MLAMLDGNETPKVSDVYRNRPTPNCSVSRCVMLNLHDSTVKDQKST